MVLLLDAEIRMDGRVQRQHAPLLTQVLMPDCISMAADGCFQAQVLKLKPQSAVSGLGALDPLRI